MPHPRLLADAPWRFPAILGLSIVLGLPALADMVLLTGDVAAAGLRYLAALGLSWLGVTLVISMIDAFAGQNRLAAQREAVEAAAAAREDAEALHVEAA